MHVTTNDNANPGERPSKPIPVGRQVKRVPPPKAKENPWDHEPAWPGGEYDDDESVADGMCDDDDDGPLAPQGTFALDSALKLSTPS